MNVSYSAKIIITDILHGKPGPSQIRNGTDNPSVMIAFINEEPSFSSGLVVTASYFTPSNFGS
jgi:hypothetical protein